MQKKVLIIGSIILVLLVGRLVFKRLDKYSAERKWYVKNLNYEFTAVVDSIEFFNARGGGFLFCKMPDGKVIRSVEDSLQNHLVQYQMLKLLFIRKNGRIAKLSWETQKYEIGDSIYLNSKTDVFRISRNSKILREGTVSDELFKNMF